MNSCTDFTLVPLLKKTAIMYGVGEEQREVLVDNIVVDYIEQHYASDQPVEEVLELIMLENVHFIEQARRESPSEDGIEEYLLNAIGATLLNITPVSLEQPQAQAVDFHDLTFQCGFTVSETVTVPSVVLSLISPQSAIAIIEQELAQIDAEDFSMDEFSSFVRGTLFHTLFSHRIEADAWVH